MKINLVIDGNYILHKNTFSLHKLNMLYGELHNSMNKSLEAFKSQHFFDNIFLVSDTGSYWRKNIHPEYKSHRNKSDDIDWEFVHTAYKEFKEDLPINVKLLESPYIEGDDWIARIVQRTNKKGYSNLIIANDHDLKQLLHFSLDPMYINLMSNEMFTRERVYIPKNYEVFMSELEIKSRDNDLFELNNKGERLRFLNKIIELKERIVVDDKESLITKIVMGDKSDNIPSSYIKESKSGRMMGIGKAGAKKIHDMYLQEFGEIKLNDDDLFENIADLICESKKLPFSEMDKIKRNLQYNMDLIGQHMMPDHIIEQMDEIIDKLNIN